LTVEILPTQRAQRGATTLIIEILRAQSVERVSTTLIVEILRAQRVQKAEGLDNYIDSRNPAREARRAQKMVGDI